MSLVLALLLGIAAAFGLFLQVLDKQPTFNEALSYERDMVTMLRLGAVPHDLGLNWTELMHKYGCDGTDPDAVVCETLEDGRHHQKNERFKAYAAEARARGATLSPGTLRAALDSALPDCPRFRRRQAKAINRSASAANAFDRTPCIAHARKQPLQT